MANLDPKEVMVINRLPGGSVQLIRREDQEVKVNPPLDESAG